MSSSLPQGLLRRIAILAAVLLLQGVLLYSVTPEEKIPPLPAFAILPEKLGNWDLKGEAELDAATREMLRPDYSLIRQYEDRSDATPATLFIGYFNTTQANHPAPHSPTVCLPGAGWKELYSREIRLLSGGDEAEFPLNEYVLEQAGRRLVVLYWYQNIRRSWANPVFSKVHILPDFLQHKRTDVALIRITLSTTKASPAEAVEKAKEFARQVQPAVRQRFAAAGTT